MRGKEYYRLLTSGFVHADWMHLMVNMFVLYSFGEYIESYVRALFGNTPGRIIFLGLNLLNIIIANIPTLGYIATVFYCPCTCDYRRYHLPHLFKLGSSQRTGTYRSFSTLRRSTCRNAHDHPSQSGDHN